MADEQRRRPFFPGNSRENLTSRYRLREFNYSTPGYYFLTLPVANRAEVLGCIDDYEMVLSDLGSAVHELIISSTRRFPHLTVEQFVVMPNHVHVLTYISIENETTTPSHYVKWLKGTSTLAYRAAVRAGSCPNLGSKLWQVGFNDEIVRNDAHLENVRRYIAENPARRSDDELC
jgi:REP element-mobilizing transposase RayT